MVPRRLSLSLIVPTAIAFTCMANATESETGDPVGVYDLLTVNGKGLPANVSHGDVELKVHSGTFTIGADGNCSSSVRFGPPSGAEITRDVKATYTREGSTLKMQWEGAGRTVGTVKGETFSMDNEGVSFAYTKQTALAKQKVLDQFIGNWISKSPRDGSAEETSKVDLTYRQVLGGRFVEEDGKSDDGATTKLLYTYDPEHMCYRLWSFRSWTQPSEATGEWDADSKTFTWTSVGSDGQDPSTIATHHFVDENTMEWDAKGLGAAGEVVWQVNGIATRVGELED